MKMRIGSSVLFGMLFALKPAFGQQQHRNLDQRQSSGSSDEEAESPAPIDYRLFIDKTIREGLGENLGFVSMEYLGTGYNGLLGNPRGNPETGQEDDPGWRRPVIKLVQDQARSTIDLQTLVPYGVSFKRLTSCDFSSKATELSTSSDYQKQISHEASLGGVFKVFSFQASIAYKSFRQTQESSKETSFESRAECAELRATLEKYHEHEPEDLFKKAVDQLPDYFDPDDDANKRAYLDFYEEFGTHYTKSVVLGAKHIFTTRMKSRDFMELRRDSIDVSVGVAASNVPGSTSADDFIPKGDDDGQSMCCCGGGDDDGGDDVTPPATKSGGIGYRFSRSTESKDKISSKTTSETELNIGGRPSAGNWKDWAATIQENLMPIKYELEPLEDIIRKISLEKASAFFELNQFVIRREGLLDGVDYTTGCVKENLVFGVSRGDGVAISPYSVSPQARLRSAAILSLPGQVIPGTEALDPPEFTSEFPFVTYDVVWDNAEAAVSAFFATFIRDNVSPNTQEDQFEYGFFEGASVRACFGGVGLFVGRRCYDVPTLLNPNPYLFPFTLQASEFQAKLAVFEKGTDAKVLLPKLPSFSYLAADNRHPDEEECSSRSFVSGSVHPDGYSLNEVFGRRLGFSIMQINDNIFEIWFDEEFESPPTFVVSPLWFAPEQVYPTSISELVVGVSYCDKIKCRVHTGSKTTQYTLFDFFIGFLRTKRDTTNEDIINQYLGFSFLALDENLDNTGLIHGKVESPRTVEGDVPEGTVALQNTTTFKADSMFEMAGLFTPGDPAGNGTTTPSPPINATNETLTEEPAGGVLITFKKCFSSIPSVIVTPEIVFNDDNDPRPQDTEYDDFMSAKIFEFGADKPQGYAIPVAIVEHITKCTVLVKAGFLDTLSYWTMPADERGNARFFTPTAFHFVATGPVEIPRDNPFDSIDSNFSDPGDAVDIDAILATSTPGSAPSVTEKFYQSQGVVPTPGPTPDPSQRHSEQPSVPPTESPTPGPTPDPSQHHSEQPSVPPTESPTPGPTPEPSQHHSEQPSVPPTELPYCFDNCLDDKNFRSKRSNLPCYLHTSLGCREWGVADYTEAEISELIAACPCTCKIDCKTQVDPTEDQKDDVSVNMVEGISADGSVVGDPSTTEPPTEDPSKTPTLKPANTPVVPTPPEVESDGAEENTDGDLLPSDGDGADSMGRAGE